MGADPCWNWSRSRSNYRPPGYVVREARAFTCSTHLFCVMHYYRGGWATIRLELRQQKFNFSSDCIERFPKSGVAKSSGDEAQIFFFLNSLTIQGGDANPSSLGLSQLRTKVRIWHKCWFLVPTCQLLGMPNTHCSTPRTPPSYLPSLPTIPQDYCTGRALPAQLILFQGPWQSGDVDTYLCAGLSPFRVM